MNISGNKPCPICGKTISANKSLCMACLNAHGSLEAYQAALAAEKPKRTRKPKVDAAVAAMSTMSEKPKRPRKSKSTEPVMAAVI